MQPQREPLFRIGGAVLMLACLVSFDSTSHSLLQRLLLPLAMGLATGLIVRNLTVPAIAGLTLGAIHTQLTGDWVQAAAYPLIAGFSLATLIWLLGQRFRRHIANTHAARWRHRNPGVRSNPDPKSEPPPRGPA